MLLLKRSEVRGLVSMDEAIDAVEDAFKKHGQGKTIFPAKTQFELPPEEGKPWRWWGFMPSYVQNSGLGAKIVCDYPENKKVGRNTIISSTVLCDEDSGAVKAVMDSTELTALRTGALGGVAAKHLSRKDVKTAGVIGCGVQARTQLEALISVRGIEKVMISDLHKESAQRFKEEMSKLGVDISIEGPEALVRGSDVIITATLSSEPVLLKDWLNEGSHITSIGAHTPDARELGPGVMSDSRVVLDAEDAYKSGDLINALNEGLAKEEILEIKDVVNGKNVRCADSDITIFKSVGTSLQDIAISSIVYEKAVKKGLGVEIDLEN